MDTDGRKSLTRAGGKNRWILALFTITANVIRSIAYMINENSIQFNVVSKNLGGERMAFFLNEAAGDIRDIMMPTLESKPKL